MTLSRVEITYIYPELQRDAQRNASTPCAINHAEEKETEEEEEEEEEEASVVNSQVSTAFLNVQEKKRKINRSSHLTTNHSAI